MGRVSNVVRCSVRSRRGGRESARARAAGGRDAHRGAGRRDPAISRRGAHRRPRDRGRARGRARHRVPLVRLARGPDRRGERRRARRAREQLAGPSVRHRRRRAPRHVPAHEPHARDDGAAAPVPRARARDRPAPPHVERRPDSAARGRRGRPAHRRRGPRRDVDPDDRHADPRVRDRPPLRGVRVQRRGRGDPGRRGPPRRGRGRAARPGTAGGGGEPSAASARSDAR